MYASAPRPTRRTRAGLSALVMVLIACLLALPLVAPAAPAHAAGIIYVDASASSGANDGSSWANAYTTLQAALTSASSGDEIWVAAGTYYPDEGGGQTDNDRTATFQLISGVAIYGGYPTGGGTRDWAANPTILSGDIGTTGDNSDNAYHVVTGANNATLDGFTITAGNANGNYVSPCGPACGGGMYNFRSSPVLTNITISGNQGGSGGGMYNRDNSPVLTNVTISGNQATNTGGGVENSDSTVKLTNVIISGNLGGDSGGGMYNRDGSRPILINVTIAGNHASNNGGGMYNDGGNQIIWNSIIWGNSTQVYNTNSTQTYRSSLVQGQNPGGDNLDGTSITDPGFLSAKAASSAPTTAGDYRLLPTATAVNMGDYRLLPVGVDTDLIDNPRIQGDNVDLGAYEVLMLYVDQDASPGGDGSSWHTAFQRVQDALAAANTCAEIWVAAGAYTPGSIQASTFQLGEGVAIYGGFAGSETTRDQRNWEANVTILSGDIGGDDTNTDGNNIAETWNDIRGSNAYHVVKGANNTILDGFTITAGKSDRYPNTHGGGIRNTSRNMQLMNVTLIGNVATYWGGGIYNSGTMTLINNFIISNKSFMLGGGIDNRGTMTLLRSTIRGNVAKNAAGGISNRGTMALTNSTISGNQALTGSGINNPAGRISITNSTISNNAGGTYGGIYSGTTGNVLVTLQNSIVWGNAPFPEEPQIIGTFTYANSLVQGWSVGGFTGSEDPRFVSPIADPTNDVPTTAGDYRLLPGSPVIDQGNNAYLDETQANRDLNGDGDQDDMIDTDLADNPRIVGSTTDLGAYEAPVFTISKISGDNQQATAGSSFANPLVVSVDVSDTSTYPGYPVEGGSVTFSSPASGASTDPQSTNASIDGSGQASASVAANNEAGSYTVSASAAGVSGSVDFSLTNLNRIVRITRADASPTNANSVDFTVTFVGGVHNLSANNFRLTHTGSASGNIANVSGSDATWTVTVASISGDGTLGLEMINDAGVMPLGVGNLPYTTGDAYEIDTIAPTAPSVSSTTPTSDTLPLWTWASDGSDGNGTYRYKLDDSDLSSGATETTDTSYMPASGLADGSHTLSVQERDDAGNWSSSGSFTILVDSTAPAVSLTDAPNDPSGSTEANISFSADDDSGSGIASIVCQLDGGAWEPCNSPVSYSDLSDGEHTVTVQATDNVGNSTSASHTWTVDSTLPTVSITAAPDGPSRSTEASISFTATDSDGIASLECQLNGGAWEPCSSPVSYTGLSDGEHTVTVRATDNAGNTGTASHTWTIDTALPVVSITTAPSNPSGSTDASISFSGDDGTGSGIAGYECQLDGGAWEACSSPVSYTGLSDGEHTVTVRATDNVGNTGNASHTWTIDSTLPAVSITAGPEDPSGSTEASISFTASDSDGIARLECQLDGGTWEPCSSPVSYGGLSDGEHTVTVRATDNVGNTGSASHTWTVDSIPPAAAAPRIYLPLVMRSGTSQPADAAPDLVGSVAIAPNQRSFAAGEPVAFTVTITNVGNAATEAGFWVDLYLNPTATPTVNQPWQDLCGLQPCHGIVWSVSELLEPGESIIRTSTAPSYAADYTRWPGWLARGTTDVYVAVDSWNCDANGEQCVAGGAVAESDETNNLTHLGGLTVTAENPASLLAAPVVAPRTALPLIAR